MLIEVEVTADEVKEASLCLDTLFEAIPKSKKPDYLGELNDLGIFIMKVKKGIRLAEEKTNHTP